MMKRNLAIAGAGAALLGGVPGGMSDFVEDKKSAKGPETDEITVAVKPHGEFSMEQASVDEEHFKSLDTNGDGVLSLEEFKNSATMSGLGDVLAVCRFGSTGASLRSSQRNAFAGAGLEKIDDLCNLAKKNAFVHHQIRVFG